MTTVFIGGSRTISRLNPKLRERLDYILKCGAHVLIGDSNGADKAIQQFLAGQGHTDVVVYFLDQCRNNLGNWPTRQVGMEGAAPSPATRDLALINDAKCGVMLWDGKSPETPALIRQLLAVGKKTLVYFAPGKTFHNLSSEVEFDEFLARCGGNAA